MEAPRPESLLIPLIQMGCPKAGVWSCWYVMYGLFSLVGLLDFWLCSQIFIAIVLDLAHSSKCIRPLINNSFNDRSLLGPASAVDESGKAWVWADRALFGKGQREQGFPRVRKERMFFWYSVGRRCYGLLWASWICVGPLATFTLGTWIWTAEIIVSKSPITSLVN